MNNILKDFLPEPKRQGVWNFYNPKNLYITDEQIYAYLDLMGEKTYASKFHDKTEILISKNTDSIIE